MLHCENAGRLLCYSYEGVVLQSLVNAIMIVLNAYVCYWSISHWGLPLPLTILILDVVSAAVLVVEVMIRLVSHGCRAKEYFTGYRNGFDFVLMLLTIFTMFTFELEFGTESQEAGRTELPVTSLRILRDISRILRVLYYIAHLRRSLIDIATLGEDHETLPLNPDGLRGFVTSPTQFIPGAASWPSSSVGEPGDRGRPPVACASDLYVPRNCTSPLLRP
eukprot:EG_transcript_23441